MNNEIVGEKKNNTNKTNKILIAIIIILLLLLGGLSYYTFFVRDKEVDKPNPVVEPTKPVEEVDYSIDTYEGTYSTYTADTSEIDKIVTSLPYSNIINENISHNQLWKTYEVFGIVNNLKSISIGAGSNISHKDDIKDSKGVTYPEYTTEAEKIAKDCGLTVEEINKIDKSLWTTGGQYSFVLYDMNELKTKYSEIYRDMFDKSFTISKNDTALWDFWAGMFYDHNVDKLVQPGAGGGTPGSNKTISIVNKKKENNNYIVEIEEKTTQYDAPNPIVVSDNYIITFKLVDGYYQFDNIVKK